MKENILQENGLKNTENRRLILKVLEDARQPLAAEEIFLKTRQQRELNFSTVYRTLSILNEKEIILKQTGGDGKAYFQINKHEHSHYLICSDCRKRIAIEGCPLKEMGENLVKETGFHITGHHLEFIGECPECLEKRNKPER